MCFSTEVSFTASSILIVIGAVCISKSSSAPQVLFSSIPVLFGIQQAAEGMLWFGLSSVEPSALVMPAKYLFLTLAQVVWPVLVPVSILALESEPVKQKELCLIVVVGALVSAYLMYCLIFYKTDVTIDCYHILYSMHFPKQPVSIVGVIYLLATIGSVFVSSIKELRALALSIVLSLIVTVIFYRYYLVSVWCFFAAVQSVEILHIIVKLNRMENLAKGTKNS